MMLEPFEGQYDPAMQTVLKYSDEPVVHVTITATCAKTKMKVTMQMIGMDIE
jgi:hypothetical protein